MRNGGFNQINLERWLENNQTTLIFGGVLLLVFGLILLALRRANLSQNRDLKRENDVRLSAISAERRGMTMQPGLREDRKISEYEKKKRVANSVLTVFEGIILGIVLLFIFSIMHTTRGGWNSSLLLVLFYPVIIGIGIVIVLYLSNALICAVFDHVIEMCYANQYRIMHGNSNVAVAPAPETTTVPAPETDVLKN